MNLKWAVPHCQIFAGIASTVYSFFVMSSCDSVLLRRGISILLSALMRHLNLSSAGNQFVFKKNDKKKSLIESAALYPIISSTETLTNILRLSLRL
jgi:hypothetical protein